MSFRYNTTQIYSGSREANPDTYYTSSNSASYVGGVIWITGSANIYTKNGEAITANTPHAFDNLLQNFRYFFFIKKTPIYKINRGSLYIVLFNC